MGTKRFFWCLQIKTTIKMKEELEFLIFLNQRLKGKEEQKKTKETLLSFSARLRLCVSVLKKS